MRTALRWLSAVTAHRVLSLEEVRQVVANGVCLRAPDLD